MHAVRGNYPMAETKENAKTENHNAQEESSERVKPTLNPAIDMLKAFAQQGKVLMDRDALISNHRKNLDAINDASKTTIDLLKSVTALQNQYVKQTFEDFNAMLRDMTQKPQAPDQWENSAARFKESMTKAVDHSSNVANIVVKTNGEFFKKVQEQAQETFKELKFPNVASRKH